MGDGLYRVGVGGGERLTAVAARLEAALLQMSEHLPGRLVIRNKHTSAAVFRRTDSACL